MLPGPAGGAHPAAGWRGPGGSGAGPPGTKAEDQGGGEFGGRAGWGIRLGGRRERGARRVAGPGRPSGGGGGRRGRGEAAAVGSHGLAYGRRQMGPGEKLGILLKG